MSPRPSKAPDFLKLPGTHTLFGARRGRGRKIGMIQRPAFAQKKGIQNVCLTKTLTTGDTVVLKSHIENKHEF